MSALEVRFIRDISSIPAREWNALLKDDYPFIKHEFLQALEVSRAVGEGTGWMPSHLVLYRDDELVAALPCYEKVHSFGEYVFDQSWANAYHANSLEYYPKLSLAIPFTPITGPRLICSSHENAEELYRVVLSALEAECQQEGFSSWHVLFADKETQSNLKGKALERRAVHFRWINKGYASFDDFLAAFSSRKRKNLRKERQSIQNEGIRFEVLSGTDISPEHWQQFYYCYQLTYAKKSGHGGYLPKSFFEDVARTMSESIVLVFAVRDEQAIAAALNFRDSNNLYGRYWGCIEECKHLHFETCYYQGIEYAITHGLKGFDPGVQGEHKIQRGFEPRYTYSYHWLIHEGFRQAVGNFLSEEKGYVEQYLSDANELLPFKSE